MVHRSLVVDAVDAGSSHTHEAALVNLNVSIQHETFSVTHCVTDPVSSECYCGCGMCVVCRRNLSSAASR